MMISVFVPDAGEFVGTHSGVIPVLLREICFAAEPHVVASQGPVSTGRVEVGKFLWVAVAMVRVCLHFRKSFCAWDNNLIAIIENDFVTLLIKMLLSVGNTALFAGKVIVGCLHSAQLFLFLCCGKKGGVRAHSLALAYFTLEQIWALVLLAGVFGDGA